RLESFGLRRRIGPLVALLLFFNRGCFGLGAARRLRGLCLLNLRLFGTAPHAEAHSKCEQRTNSDALHVQTSRKVTVLYRPTTRSCVAAISALLVPKKSSNCGVEIYFDSAPISLAGRTAGNVGRKHSGVARRLQ